MGPGRLADELKAFIAAQKHFRFVWGSNDCAMFMADWVEQLDGVDPAAEWRFSYLDAKGALRCMDANGGLAKMAARTGWEPVDSARLGDFALIEPGPNSHRQLQRFAVAGDGTWILRAPQGLLIDRRENWHMIRSWRRPV